MQFEASINLPNATGVDPETNPIGRDKLLYVSPRLSGADVPNQAVTFFLEAPVGETITIDLWAVREDQPKNLEPSTPDPIPSTRFALIATGLVITGSRLLQQHVKGVAGALYAEVTAETLSTERTLFAGGSPNVEPPAAA